jgi:hypothetical protein
MFRSKTAKRGSKKNNLPVSPITPSNPSEPPKPVPLIVEPHVSVQSPKNEISTESMLSALLDADAKTNITLPWLRIDRGIRIKLLRAYVEKLTDYTTSERNDILIALVEALDKKYLNSKSQISYEPEKGITDISCLKITKGVGNKLLIRIEPANRNTKKAKRHSANDSD